LVWLRDRVSRLNQRSGCDHGRRGKQLFEHDIVPQIRRSPRTHQVDA
jgi:hypothetical protein